MVRFDDRNIRPMPKPVRHEGTSPHAALGVISAALFVVALAAAPFAGALLTRSLSEAGAFSFTASHASLAATRRALDEAAADLTEQSPDRLGAWNDMIARELAEGDESAARGLMLAAGAIVGQDARAVEQARAESGVRAALAAARPLLGASIANQATEAGLFAAPETAPMAAAGDARDLAVQARAWLDGRGAAMSELVLTGVSVAAPELAAQFGVSAQALQSGVVTLKAALRSGRLAPDFVAGVQATLQAVDADGRLGADLRSGLVSDAALADEPGAARAAFVAALSPSPEWRAVADLLLAVDALNARTSWTGAVEMLAQASTVADMPRLQLLADARGETATALAKRIADPATFLALARTDFAMTSTIQVLLALLGVCLGAVLIAPGVTLAHAVMQLWGQSAELRPGGDVRRHPGPRRAPQTPNRIAA